MTDDISLQRLGNTPACPQHHKCHPAAAGELCHKKCHEDQTRALSVSFVSFLRLESGFNASNSILFVKLPAKSQNCAVSLPGAQNFIMVLFRFKKPKMQAFIFKDT